MRAVREHLHLDQCVSLQETKGDQIAAYHVSNAWKLSGALVSASAIPGVQ